MKKFKVIWLVGIALMIYACGTGEREETPAVEEQEVPESIKEGKGIGQVEEVELTDPLDPEMIARGREHFVKQCRDCHKLDSKELIGPGFESITNKRRPEWIMNMITDTKLMLELDPTAHELLGLADQRAMPHQALTVEEARDMLEFLRQNDLDQVGTKDGAVVN